MSENSEIKQQLYRDITGLKSELIPVFLKDKERVEGEGRPFSTSAWWAGELDDGKYPGGPVFHPIGLEPTFSNCLRQASATDLAVWGAGNAFLYGFGFWNAKRLGISRGHRFGLLLTLPNILAGGLFVAQRGMFRYLGFVDNGNPPLYPNYMVDHTPYFVKHRVSDKHQ